MCVCACACACAHVIKCLGLCAYIRDRVQFICLSGGMFFLLVCMHLYAVVCVLHMSGCIRIHVWVHACVWGCTPHVLQIMGMCVYVCLCAHVAAY